MDTSQAAVGRLGRVAAVVVFGGASHLGVLWVGELLVQRLASEVTASCIETDCQPQYYFAVGIFHLFVILPSTYLLGWAAIIGVGRLTVRRWESRLVPRLILAAVYTPGLLAACLLSLPEGNRSRLLMGAIAVVPIVVSGIVVACTPCRRGDSAIALPAGLDS